MSLELHYSLPRGISVKTFGSVCGLGGVHLWVPVPPGQSTIMTDIAATDFVEMARYVLENTNLEPDDPRLPFIETIRDGRFVADPASPRQRFIASAWTEPPASLRVLSMVCEGDAVPEVYVLLLSESVTAGVRIEIPLLSPQAEPSTVSIQLPLERFLFLLLVFLTGAPYERYDPRESFVEHVRALTPVPGWGSEGKRLALPRTTPAKKSS